MCAAAYLICIAPPVLPVCTSLQFGDMERLDIQDEYSELSRKTARLFSQMSSSVRADFYFKIDDDVGEWLDCGVAGCQGCCW